MAKEKRRDEAAFDICKKCKAFCCTMGGTDFTEKEMKRIIDAGHPVKFKKIRKNNYEMNTDGKGSCAYLKDSVCTIYNERPNICRAFPIDYPYRKKDGKTEYSLYLCPLGKTLAEDDIRLLKKNADKIGAKLCTGYADDKNLPSDEEIASNIRRLHEKERKLCIKRANKFKTKEV